MKTVVVLGGYGNFGKRICETLAQDSGIRLLCCGRHSDKARALVAQLQPSAKAELQAVVLDINAADFRAQLQDLTPFLVIHTGGPFQGQNYRVAEACIAIGAHYLDLADDRRFVCDITLLNKQAEDAGVQIISGASSVPGLSSAVIEHYQSRFRQIDSIDIAIAPGNQAERGEATLRGILSYTGRPFSVFEQGGGRTVYGWMNSRRKYFGPELGWRWLANVDVPDLELFPAQFAVTERVRFQASLELTFLHFSMLAMASLARLRLIKNWAPATALIYRMSHWFSKLGSADGAMQIDIAGLNTQGAASRLRWRLEAYDGIGPFIPTLSTIIIARQLLAGQVNPGARACSGEFSLAEFYPYAQSLGLVIREEQGD
ncbi:saccharopine dehydrogenase family protein [Thalassolituus hydrocarboniclasticus]|uniref:Saccharopine dehydrogenase NADP-binding domain-containing protein n=1 Tax=Thalassolituus hydrocarboniclasticus TaxID=2742796 RepID=A0ABY6ACW8_9GAMM|nr:saccharopine dehydrogenase NADP-binding domain-containing protein [Thalassolituus hydrocarboniclasticus]UXD88121.1 saccharopine dehydrogenase NADP-binding domain-containing protein [Thalassolituus hydrocarboniclasticus]